MVEKSNETEGTNVKVGADTTTAEVKDKAAAESKGKPAKGKPAKAKPAKGNKPSTESVSSAMSKGFSASSGTGLYDKVLDYLIQHPKGATPDEIATLTGQSSTVIRGVIRRQAGVSTRKGVRFAEVKDGKHWLFVVNAPPGTGGRLLYKVTKAGKVPPEVEPFLTQPA